MLNIIKQLHELDAFPLLTQPLQNTKNAGSFSDYAIENAGSFSDLI